jgi:hypothetical protein
MSLLGAATIGLVLSTGPVAATSDPTAPGGTTSQLVVHPDGDTYLTGPANPDINFGASPRAWVGTDQQNAQRPLLRFTLGAPSNATVLTCTLSVQADMVQAPLPGHVLRVTQSGWTETGATWNRYDGTTPWTTPGGDVDAASGIPFPPPAAAGPFAFPDLTALCQDALAARGGQLDLLIRQDMETPGTPPHQWSFVTSNDTASSAMPPELTVSLQPVCDTTATFSAVVCRLTVLGMHLESDAADSAFRVSLLATLQGRVLGSVQQAEQFATRGNRGRARARLGQAARALASFARRLNSPPGRKAVPQSSGQQLGNEARAIRKTIATLPVA